MAVSYAIVLFRKVFVVYDSNTFKVDPTTAGPNKAQTKAWGSWSTALGKEVCVCVRVRDPAVARVHVHVCAGSQPTLHPAQRGLISISQQR